MIKTNTEKITVDDDGSVSSISDLDVKEIDRPILRRQESTGYCPHKLELDPSPSSIHVPKLRRERQSDYGMFNKNFEDDVLNWFHCINKNKKIELIHILVDMISYDDYSRNAFYVDSPRLKTKSDYIRLGAQEPNLDVENNQDLSIKLDDIEDLSQNDTYKL